MTERVTRRYRDTAAFERDELRMRADGWRLAALNGPALSAPQQDSSPYAELDDTLSRQVGPTQGLGGGCLAVPLGLWAVLVETVDHIRGRGDVQVTHERD